MSQPDHPPSPHRSATTSSESKYADGLGEYADLYGGTAIPMVHPHTVQGTNVGRKATQRRPVASSLEVNHRTGLSSQAPEVNHRVNFSSQAPEINHRIEFSSQAPELDRVVFSSQAPELNQNISYSTSPEVVRQTSLVSTSQDLPLRPHASLNSETNSLPTSQVASPSNPPPLPPKILEPSRSRPDEFQRQTRPVPASLSNDIHEIEVPAMTAKEAQAEIILRLDKEVWSPPQKENKQEKRRSTALLKSFGVKRQSTIEASRKTTAEVTKSGYSLEKLTNVLEGVAGEGNLTLVEAALDLGADLHYRSITNRTSHQALQNAASAGSTSVVDFFLRRGVSFNPRQSTLKGVSSWTRKLYHDFEPIDYALLDAVKADHFDLAMLLFKTHSANWKTITMSTEANDGKSPAAESVISTICQRAPREKWIRLLTSIMSHATWRSDQIAHIDFGSEGIPKTLAGKNVTSWNNTAAAVLVAANWVEALEQIPDLKNNLYYQYLSKYKKETSGKQVMPTPISCISAHSYATKPAESLLTLNFLLAQGSRVEIIEPTSYDRFDLTNNFTGHEPLSRAVVGGSIEAVDAILKHDSKALKHSWVQFKHPPSHGYAGNEVEFSLLYHAIDTCNLEMAKLLVKYGAHPRDYIRYKAEHQNLVLLAIQYAASKPERAPILQEFITQAPELNDQAIIQAVSIINPPAVRILLENRSWLYQQSGTIQLAPVHHIYSSLLSCKGTDADAITKANHVEMVDDVIRWAQQHRLPRPMPSAVMYGILAKNYIGLERVLNAGFVTADVLNMKEYNLIGDFKVKYSALEFCRKSERTPSMELWRLIHFYGGV